MCFSPFLLCCFLSQSVVHFTNECNQSVTSKYIKTRSGWTDFGIEGFNELGERVETERAACGEAFDKTLQELFLDYFKKSQGRKATKKKTKHRVPFNNLGKRYLHVGMENEAMDYSEEGKDGGDSVSRGGNI